MFRRLLAWAACGLSVYLASAVFAAAPEPPYPDNYDVTVRYGIRASGTARLGQYNALMATLKDAGFVRAADDEPAEDEPVEPTYTRVRGTIPAKGVNKVLAQRAVQSLLLVPAGAKLPEKDGRVRVDLQLPVGYLPDAQRALARDAASVLTKDAGFVEAVGYDTRGDSRLVGSVPAGKLDAVLNDTRLLPSGKDLPRPFATATAVRFVLARPDLPVPAALPAPVVIDEKARKFAPDFRKLLGDDAAASRRTRFEAILGYTPPEGDRGWRKPFEIDGLAVEDRLGPIVSLAGSPKEVAAKLAESPDVAHLRLPVSGRIRRLPAADDAPLGWEPLRAVGVKGMHEGGRIGVGSRIAVVGDDFTGWEALKGRTLGAAKLPDPKLIDLTALRNDTLVGDPAPGKGEGDGTRMARTVLKNAPGAEVFLVRIDASSPAMLQTVAHAVNGSRLTTPSLAARLDEIRGDDALLQVRAEALGERREKLLGNPGTDEEYLKEKAAYEKDAKAQAENLAAFVARRKRYFDLVRAVESLKGVRLVASSLVWTHGYPAGGGSALSRSFDERPFKAALWFQAVGDHGAQAWSGLFRDENGDGVMEFAEADKRLARGAWNHQVNFLAWSPAKGSPSRALPGGTKLRVSMAWREAHDALPLKAGEDPYREPLAKLRLLVVFQPDPDGKARPADDLEVVASSAEPPVRLDQTAHAATYEHVVTFDATRPGRYGVIVEGKLPASIHPAGENRLPSGMKVGEVRPRLFVATESGDGRAVFGSYSTPGAAIGSPADSRSVLTVGSADAEDKAREDANVGSPAGMELTRKPDLLAYDGNGGTAQAAAFAAGLVATTWPNTASLIGVERRVRDHAGRVIRVPERGRAK